MRQMRSRSFFELTWTIFRFAMKSIFVVLSILYVFAGLVVFLLSPELGTAPIQQFIISLVSALLFGLVFVSYVTLLLAVPISAFCAFAAFSVTAVVRLYETAFPVPGHARWMDQDECEPGAVEVIDSHVMLESAVCPVCAAGLEHAKTIAASSLPLPQAQLVSCLRCEALHHQECWTYVGNCATFGCGSDRARPSREPAPEDNPEWSSWREKWLRRADAREKVS